MLSSVSAALDSSLASFSLVPSAYADELDEEEDSTEEESSTDDTSLIYLDDSGNVVYNGEHVIDTSASVDSWSEYSNGVYYEITYYSSAASTLAFESDDIAFGTLMYVLGFKVSTNSGSFGSGYVGYRSVEFFSGDNFITLLSSVNFYTSYLPSILSSLGVGVSHLSSIATQTTANATSINLTASRLLEVVNLLDDISGISGATNNLITAGFSNVIDAINDIEGSSDSQILTVISDKIGSTNNLITAGFSDILDYLSYISNYVPYLAYLPNISGSDNSEILSYLNALNNLISAGFADVIEAIEGISITVDGSGSSSDSSSWISDLLSGLSELLDTLLSGISSLLETILEGLLSVLDLVVGEFDASAISLQLNTLSTTFSTSFPFGAISMVASALSALSTSATAPYISWEFLGAEIVIDLSDFDSVATGCRYFLLVLYVIGLYKSTKDWAFGGGD